MNIHHLIQILILSLTFYICIYASLQGRITNPEIYIFFDLEICASEYLLSPKINKPFLVISYQEELKGPLT